MNIVMPSPNPQLSFNNYPNFRPFYTPEEIVNMGVYGGSMWAASLVYGTFFDLIPDTKYIQPKYNPDYNFFKIRPTSNIYYSLGPEIKRKYRILNWLEWYIQFYHGYRDNKSDVLMMAYWNVNIFGLTFYFRNAVSYTPPEGSPNLTPFTDLSYLPEYRQALLELGWDSTKDYNLVK